MGESNTILHSLLASIYRMLDFSVISVLQQKQAAREELTFKETPKVSKPPTSRKTISLPSLNLTASDFEKLLDEAAVEISTVLQAAVALMLHFYNSSEATVFIYEDSSSKALTGCSLHVQPAETTIELLRRLYVSRTPKNGQVLDDEIHWTRLEKHDPSYKATILFNQAGNQKIQKTSDIVFETSFTRKGRLTVVMNYSILAVSEGLAWSMLNTLSLVLRGMRKSSWLAVGEFDICSRYDREIVRGFTSSISRAEDRCVHEFILDHCRSTPNAVAISSTHESDVTYSELDEITSKLAHHLIELGVGPEKFVLCCFGKSKWAIIARMAVLRAGGAYIMIDAKNPPGYLNSIVKRSSVKMMMTSSEHKAAFQDLVPTVVELSQKTLQALPDTPTPLNINVTADNACLILFTSGSTGQPKGIIQTHRSYSTAIRDYTRKFKIGPKTRLYQFDEYTFDISNNDYMAPLMTGGRCCVPRSSNTLDSFVEEVNIMKANATFLTPTVANQLDPELVPSLDLIFIGGEVMCKDLLNKWSGKAKIINQYGMGEVATFCAYEEFPSASRIASIGRPGCNAIWIVSLATPDKLMPVGAVGEVLIEGPNVGRGYLDLPANNTSAGFLEGAPLWLQDLHPERTKSAFYLSGDLARYNHDGTLEFLGRKDLLLKLDGCRVDAIEVEHLSRKHLTADDAIVIDLLGCTGGDDKPELTAYLYLHDNPLSNTIKGDKTIFRPGKFCAHGSSKIKEIEAALFEILPSFMVPSNFLLVNQIPKTGSKKTDRKKLKVQAEEYWKNVSQADRESILHTLDVW
ncbi:lysergyl peptide synthetase LpsB [Amylocarpus encephaloides]|uniref:Lysergyl peptide synthetase LpsB n=1 Tax=Amylocarpus encephaloides TaxID=45428 RepID=A0A9P7YBJ1_9HELO|nr:lysergyl peptide synthetase LpsB [Amylocarpus encephaloides]